MPLFADDFLAGSLLSLLLPLCLLIVIAIWYVHFARRAPDTHPSSPAQPSPEVVASASDVDEVQPAGPPPGEIR